MYLLILILLITYIIGSVIEKMHFKKIISREIALIEKPLINSSNKDTFNNKKIKDICLVSGEVVISGDYFKNYIASLKSLIGGKLTTFESLMDRAKREAILRMREKAINADIVVNVKIESVNLSPSEKGYAIPKVAVIAYGTAITYAPYELTPSTQLTAKSFNEWKKA